MNTNPLAGLIGFWMVMQLIAALLLIAGGIYLLYSLGRAAAGLERMASALEDWVALQQQPHHKQDGNPEPQSGTPPPPPPLSPPPLPVVPPSAQTGPTPITEKESREDNAAENHT